MTSEPNSSSAFLVAFDSFNPLDSVDPAASLAAAAALRDEGLDAFQREDLRTAKTKLIAAIQQNPQDGMAFLYLGGIYNQMGLHQEALQLLYGAAQLLPQQPEVYYNLGIVQETLTQNAEAFASYQQAVALQPNYPLAQQGMERLQDAAASVPVANGVAPSLSADATLTLATLTATSLTATSAPLATGLAGTPSPTAQSTHGHPPIVAPAGTPSNATRTAPKKDSFNPLEAFQDFIRILFAPRRFFAEEEGARGQAAPNAMLLVLATVTGVGSYMTLLIQGQSSFLRTASPLFTIPIAWVRLILVSYVLSGVLYGLCRIFRGKGSYTGAYRACAYGWAPYTLMGVIASLLGLVVAPTPVTSPFTSSTFNQSRTASIPSRGFAALSNRRSGAASLGSQIFASPLLQNLSRRSERTGNPISSLLMMIGFLWGSVILGAGLKATQRLSSRAAVGVVVLQMVVWVVIILIGVILGVAAPKLIAAMTAWRTTL